MLYYGKIDFNIKDIKESKGDKMITHQKNCVTALLPFLCICLIIPHLGCKAIKMQENAEWFRLEAGLKQHSIVNLQILSSSSRH